MRYEIVLVDNANAKVNADYIEIIPVQDAAAKSTEKKQNGRTGK